jgi:Tol biopolymer transport system component
MWNGANQNNFDIYVKMVGAGPPLRLTSDPAADSSPAWSPDGRSIAFLRELSEGRFSVLLVPPIGGPERKLAEVIQSRGTIASRSPQGAGWRYLCWSPDGHSLAVVDQEAPGRPAGLFLLSIDTQEKRRLTSPPPPSSWDYTPAFSPDGRTLAFARVKANSTPDILLLPLSIGFQPQGEPKLLPTPGNAFFGVAWTLDGREIIAGSSGNLWRIPANGSSTPKRLAFTIDDSYNPSLSRQGNRLAYSRGVSDRNIWRLEITGTERKAGQPVSFISSTRREDSAQFSPDGKKIAFYSDRSGNAEIWVCDSDGTSPVQVTTLGGPACGTPRWSPDGEQIAFDSNPDGHWDMFVVAASGGKPRRLTNQPSFEAIPSWSHDGKWVYFCSDRSGERQIWRMPAQGGEPVQVTRKGGLVALESPDGRSVYYTKTEEGKEGLWSASLAGGEETQVIDSLIASRAFSVAVDGIYFITGTPYTIEFFSFRTHQHRPLANVEDDVIYLTVSPDGRSILWTQDDHSGNDLMLVENFR